MKTDYQRIIGMLEGELKEKRVAVRFLKVWTNNLSFFKERDWNKTKPQKLKGIVLLDKKRKNKKRVHYPYYFRYKKTSNNPEECGFYFCNDNTQFSGIPISELKGEDFWLAVAIILKWIPRVMEEPIDDNSI